MFCGTEDATHDRILDFSTAVTGNLFAIPTVDWLEDPPAIGPPRPPRGRRLAGDPSGDAPTTAAPGPDGSLGVGSLRLS